MELKTIKTPDGFALCTPVNPRDFPLFKHCIGDTCCLKEKVFTDDFSDLFLAHGVHEIKLLKDEKTESKEHLGHKFNGDDICLTCGHSRRYAEWQDVKCFRSNTVRFKKR